MPLLRKSLLPLLAFLFVFCSLSLGQDQETDDLFTLENVFDLEYASDPQISPDGSQIVYRRNAMDIMQDRSYSNLWIINRDGKRHRPLTSGNSSKYSPVWSPSGDRLLYVSTESGSSEMHIRWMDTGESAKITNLTQSPGNIVWSPDGEQIAFTMFVPAKEQQMVSLPGKPEGAEWAKPANVIDNLRFRRDGSSGFVEEGHSHVFVIPAEGGTPRQLTQGDFNHGSPEWTPDGEHLIISANRQEDWEYNARDTELYKVSLSDGSMMQLTDRNGPDASPKVSPDGSKIAYLGYDDNLDGYQLTQLYVMNADGSGKRLLTEDFDRDLGSISIRCA